MRRFVQFVYRQCHMLRHDQRGGMVPLLAFGMILVVSAAAMGVDLTRVRALQQSLGMTADAAALAAASRLPDIEGARTAALAYVEKNMPSAEYGHVLDEKDIEFGVWDPGARTFTPSADPDSPEAAAAVRVTAQLSADNGNAVKTFFAPIIGVDAMDVAESAVAGRSGAPCVIALDPSQSPAMQLGYNSTVDADGCGVQVNSTSSRSLVVNNAASLKSADNCIGGTANISGSAAPDPREYCPGQADPLASLEPPTFSGCDYNNALYNDSTDTLQSGVYCGGLMIGGNSDVELSPGVYVMEDGAFTVLDTSRVWGSGVTIYLTGKKAKLNFNDESAIDLSAPTSGQLAGVLIFQNRNDSNKHGWNGQSTNLRGVIYLPNSELTAYSSHLITPYKSCTVIISRTIDLNSGAGLSIDLNTASCRSVLPAPYRRGVALLD